MRWLLLGALLGLLVLFPALLAALATAASVLLGEPLLVAFAAGAAARPYLPTWRRWAR